MLIISHKHRFIFVHIPKTGGMSVTSVLKQYPENAWRTRFCSWAEGAGLREKVTFHKHELAIRLKEKLPRNIFDNYFKFAFVRNPWDWHVSNYHYVLAHPEHKAHDKFKAFHSFREYAESVVADRWTQMRWITDADGRLLVDYVGRFESLGSDLEYILSVLGLSGITVPHINRTEHAPYETYYDAQARALIERASWADIEAFGYTFAGTQGKTR